MDSQHTLRSLCAQSWRQINASYHNPAPKPELPGQVGARQQASKPREYECEQMRVVAHSLAVLHEVKVTVERGTSD